MRSKVGRCDLKSNGIPVYYLYDSGGTTHICGIGFRVGAVHDPISFAGFAHMAEHLSFRGPNVERPEDDAVYNMIYRYFGGMENHNIFTNFTATFYGGPGLYYRKYIYPVMHILTDILKLRYIDAQALEIEKTVINNEFRQMDLDVAESRLDGLFLNTMYDTNPVKRGIIGDVEQLRKLTSSRVMRFLREMYVAENMFVIVFGPKKDEAVTIARKYLDDWPYRGQPASIDLNDFDRTPRLASPRVVESAVTGFAQHYAMAGFPTGCYESRDDAALDVLGKVLERRLYNVIRERGMNFYEGTYHNPAFTQRTLVHGNIGAWFATASIDFARYGRDAIVRELLKLREEKVPEALFDGLRDSAREKFIENFRDNPSKVADLVIEAVGNGDQELKHFHSYVERLNKLTSSRLREVANKYFNPNGFVGVILSPKSAQ